FQPVCYLLLFAPLLDGLSELPGGSGGGLATFTPGMLVMMGVFSAAFTGFGLIGDLRAGVIERLRVTPVRRLALLLGWTLRDALVLLVQSVLLLAAAWLLGLRAILAGVALALALVGLLGLLMAAGSYGLALALRDENALASVVQLLALPLMLLSGVLLPLSLAPGWIQTLALLNPLAHATAAARALFAGQLADPAVGVAFGALGALLLVTFALAQRALRRSTA
ncbi:MAG: ABC transporter permease, partial [Chloroflexaceae bacterium]